MVSDSIGGYIQRYFSSHDIIGNGQGALANDISNGCGWLGIVTTLGFDSYNLQSLLLIQILFYSQKQVEIR